MTSKILVTQDLAAIAAMDVSRKLAAKPLPRIGMVEWGGWIYRLGPNRYTWSQPKPGTKSSIALGIPTQTPCGIYHSHTKTLFEGAIPGRIGFVDIQQGRRWGVDVYQGDPWGNNLKWESATNRHYLIYNFGTEPVPNLVIKIPIPAPPPFSHLRKR